MLRKSIRVKRTVVGIVLLCSLSATFAQNNQGKSAEQCEAQLDKKLGVGNYQYVEILRCMDGLPPTAQNNNIFVTDFGISTVNATGAVKPYAYLTNPDSKSAIKYINLAMVLYNAVGDPIRSEIGGNSIGRLLYTGPLRHDKGEDRADWGPIWYNPSAECVKITELSVEFMNGKKIAFSGKAVNAALAEPSKNDCRPK